MADMILDSSNCNEPDREVKPSAALCRSKRCLLSIKAELVDCAGNWCNRFGINAHLAVFLTSGSWKELVGRMPLAISFGVLADPLNSSMLQHFVISG